MRHKLKKLSKVAIVGALFVGLTLASALPAFAADLTLPGAMSGEYRGEGQPTDLFDGPQALIPRAINLMLFIVGILAIVMLIWGGIRYVISGGNQEKVKDAKNTILYAVIGLVIAILGYAIVNWVISVVGTGAGGGTSV